jgi:hypothetical protein
LGKTLRESTGREDSVIGVAKDAQVSHLGELNTRYLYFSDGPEDDSRTYVLVRHATGFADVAAAIRAMSPVLIGGLIGVALCAGVSGVLSGMMWPQRA